MAIQQINLGSMPLGVGGDSQRAANTKINENFSNTEHAASRLVGTGSEQLVAAKDLFKVSQSNAFTANARSVDLNDIGVGKYTIHNTTSVNAPKYKTGTSQGVLWCSDAVEAGGGLKSLVQVVGYIENTAVNQFYVRTYARYPYTGWSNWALIYTSGNTHADGANGYLKPSSPIVMLYNNSIQSNSDAELMGAVFAKKGVGDYEIANTTGLRTEGWYIEIPNDLHGNPHVAVTIEDTEGTIRLKCFKRVFNMETFKFEPDLNSPMDIPEGRWIDLRFNDLPEEQLDEPIE